MSAAKKKGQLTRHCRIFQWVEAEDPDLAGAVRDLCLEGALSPGGGVAGVTFLYPKDKAYRDEIVQKAYSDDADEAARLIKSLIIPDALAAGADFLRRPVGSLLGVKYSVEGADAGRVRLAGGVELTPAKGFAPLEERMGRIAVWVVEKGRLPLEGGAYARPERAPRRGGAAAAGDLNNRQSLAVAVEAEFNACMATPARCRNGDPYLNRVVSLLAWLRAHAPAALRAVLPLLDYDPVVSFYLLLEPYKQAGPFLIPEEHLFSADPSGAWNGVPAFGNPVEEYKAFFAALPGTAEACATDQAGAPACPLAFRDRAAVMAAVDRVRQALARPETGKALPRLVRSTYESLAANNAIDGLGPVLPDDTRAATPGLKKLWQDELRVVLHGMLAEVRRAPYDPTTFLSLVQLLRLSRPGNNYERELLLANPDDMAANVSPRTEWMVLRKFINSTDFLYLAAAPEAIGGPGGTSAPDDLGVFNRNLEAHARLARSAAGSILSPEMAAAIRRYAQANGGALPPEILAAASQ